MLWHCYSISLDMYTDVTGANSPLHRSPVSGSIALKANVLQSLKWPYSKQVLSCLINGMTCYILSLSYKMYINICAYTWQYYSKNKQIMLYYELLVWYVIRPWLINWLMCFASDSQLTELVQIQNTPFPHQSSSHSSIDLPQRATSIWQLLICFSRCLNYKIDGVKI